MPVFKIKNWSDRSGSLRTIDIFFSELIRNNIVERRNNQQYYFLLLNSNDLNGNQYYLSYKKDPNSAGYTTINRLDSFPTGGLINICLNSSEDIISIITDGRTISVEFNNRGLGPLPNQNFWIEDDNGILVLPPINNAAQQSNDQQSNDQQSNTQQQNTQQQNTQQQNTQQQNTQQPDTESRHLNEAPIKSVLNQFLDEYIYKQHKNIILYGPPGTGKTFTTKKLSTLIASGINTDSQENEINTEYERLVSIKQIVFTTFHQSMGYEDFIEGIKPRIVGNNISYEVIDGIFKKICIAAWAKYLNIQSINFVDSNGNSTIVRTEDIINNLFDRSVEKEYGALKKEVLNSITSRKVQDKVQDESQVEVQDESQDEAQVEVQDESQDEAQVEVQDEAQVEVQVEVQDEVQDEAHSNSDNFVIIIDEINRGNISQIFGELISLIEEDKRGGQDNELRAILPYSGEPFSIPPNVFIIGTMNTADRSAESLDTALRRRFVFIEMPPDYDYLYKIFPPVAIILKAINDRIFSIKGKDNEIGHSYFSELSRLSDEIAKYEAFKRIMIYKIIPLLQEYFYNDIEKLKYVLSDQFAENKFLTKKRVFSQSELNKYNISENSDEFIEITYPMTIDLNKINRDLEGNIMNILLPPDSNGSNSEE